jgi:hypothetical protein
MPKPSKQTIINAIIKQIENGKERASVLAIIGKKWQLSRRTFDRYWKDANIQHAKLQDLAKEASDKAYIEASAEAAKKAVMSKQERLETLSLIAYGGIPLKKAMVVDGKIKYIEVVPDWMDRKAAIAELNKMDGSYAPTKVANTNKDGDDIAPPIIYDYSKLSMDELLALKALNEKSAAPQQ